jgi:hypothetical protein
LSATFLSRLIIHVFSVLPIDTAMQF